MNNLWELPNPLPAHEQFDVLLQTPTITVERIISTGQVTPSEQWYDQARSEWVVLLQESAQITYDTGEVINLVEGNYLWIAAHQKHRVSFTSQDPPCIWLALHLD